MKGLVFKDLLLMKKMNKKSHFCNVFFCNSNFILRRE